MQKFYFTVNGMGIEKGWVCFTCMQTFIADMSEREPACSLIFSNVKKHFVLEGNFSDVVSASSAIKKALKRVSAVLNKKFELDKIVSVPVKIA